MSVYFNAINDLVLALIILGRLLLILDFLTTLFIFIIWNVWCLEFKLSAVKLNVDELVD